MRQYSHSQISPEKNSPGTLWKRIARPIYRLDHLNGGKKAHALKLSFFVRTDINVKGPASVFLVAYKSISNSNYNPHEKNSNYLP